MSDILRLTPLGAGQEVGRSCVVLQYRDKTVVCDAGIHPGHSGMAALPFVDHLDWCTVDTILITHFHLDHVGALTYIMDKTNFSQGNGKVYMTHPTKALYKLVMQDLLSADLSSLGSLFTAADVSQSLTSIIPVSVHEQVSPCPGVSFTPYHAGHVLGACMYVIDILGLKILYTGDYSREEDRHLVKAEIPPIRPDVLVVESTHGVHTFEARAEKELRFTTLVYAILGRGGHVLLPVFALGMAQELLLVLEAYWGDHPDLHSVPIYYTSSLARKCMAVYQTHIHAMNADIRSRFAKGDNPFVFKHVSSAPPQRGWVQRIAQGPPCVVLASPGFMDSGNSRELLELWAPEPRNGLIITGYSVEGTLAKRILGGPDEIPSMKGGRIPRKISVDSVSFSAHVDYAQNSGFMELVDPEHVVLVHGEKTTVDRLRTAMEGRYEDRGIDRKVYTPANLETLALSIRRERVAKVIGRLAAEVPREGDVLSGLLVAKDRSYTVFDAQDLDEFTGVPVPVVTQKQRLVVGVAWELVRWHLEGMFGRIEDRVDEVNTIRVMNAVDVRQTGEGQVTLEWASRGDNDMIADATLALLAGVDQSPASVMTSPHARVETWQKMAWFLEAHFGAAALHSEPGHDPVLIVRVDGEEARVDLASSSLFSRSLAMSFADAASESLRPILLRSSTPAPNEKVLLYLEGLRESQTIGSPNSSGFPNIALPSSKLSALDNDQDFDDINSNVQDGRKTELSIGGRSAVHHPGPHDPPGPHYESFDSGPSWGNLGPLPDHASHNGGPPFVNSWESQVNGTAYTGARVPLPTSVVSPVTAPLQITVEPPSTPSGSKSHSRSQLSAAQYKSQKSAMSVAESESRETITGRAQMKASSKAPTARSTAPEETPMSPSRRSRAGSKLQSQSRTDYPPLPASTLLSPSGRTSQLLTSPRSHHRAPSISPSDSPSQAPIKAMRKLIEKEEREKLRSASTSQVNDEGTASKRGSPPPIISGNPMSPSHQSRPFSPYRHAPTNEDLLYAATAAAVQAQKAPSQVGSQVASQIHSQVNGGGSKVSHVSQHTHITHQSHHTRLSQRSHLSHQSRSQRSQAPGDEDGAATPTPSRPPSPSFSLNAAEEEMVAQALAARGAGDRTSYAPSTLEPEVVNSHFHDMDLCILLHQMDDLSTHEVVKKALRKAVRQRVKRLGMKHDAESIKQYRKSFHDHDPSVHLDGDWEPTIPREPPEWAKELINGMIKMHERLDVLGPQSFNASMPPRSQQSYAESSDSPQQYRGGETEYTDGGDQYGQTPRTQTVNINTQVTGTLAESMYQANETEIVDEEYTTGENSIQRFGTRTLMETREYLNADRDDSPGQQFLEEELYKLRVKPGGSQSALTHKTWEVARDDQGEYEEGHGAFTESGLPEIPDGGNYTERRVPSPPLPPLPQDGTRRDLVPSQNSQLWNSGHEPNEATPPPWQRIHQRLLNWAIIWPMGEIDAALGSTTRGQQVDEVSLSIWSTQTYKRYVRSRMTDVPGGKVDRLFVPPNMADAISTAVFNGRHGDACGMLRELWAPFGFDGAPRLIVVLAKHRSDASHWVVHRFSLPDGSLTTYDSYPERTLPDGRPLGWWFAIRVAWPGAIYANPDHLMQKMVRLHRPMQLNIDNSVAAAGIWRNVLMGSRAERSLDLERLRDLINTEVKNLRQRKLQGKLSISSPKPHYEDM